jgi:hypothetical protein
VVGWSALKPGSAGFRASGKNNLVAPKGTVRIISTTRCRDGYYWTLICPSMPASLWPG